MLGLNTPRCGVYICMDGMCGNTAEFLCQRNVRECAQMRTRTRTGKLEPDMAGGPRVC